MEAVSTTLTLNVNQLLQKKVQVNDLQYDYCSKFAAVACKSQTGPEIVILQKDGIVADNQTLRHITSFVTRCDAVLLSWCPPVFGQILAVVFSDNSLVFYKCSSKQQQNWSLAYEKTDLINSASCLAVGVSPAGVLLTAVGSLNGTVSVLFSSGNYETATFKAHNGGVYSLAYKNNDATFVSSGDSTLECLLATGGIDGSLKIWKLGEGTHFKLVQTLVLDTANSKAITCVSSIAWSKDGLKVLAATGQYVFVFEKGTEWNLLDTINLEKNFEKVCAVFNNERIIVTHESGTGVYKRLENSHYSLAVDLAEGAPQN